MRAIQSFLSHHKTIAKLKMIKFKGQWAGVSAVVLAALLTTGCWPFHKSSKQDFADVVTAPPTGQPPVGQATGSAGDPPVTNISTSSNGGQKNSSLPQTFAPQGEVLRKGDSLVITFSDLNNQVNPFPVQINDQGNITLIYNQLFKAAGKTRGQLETEIRERYVPNYFVRLTITVHIQDRYYFVDGEVKAPSRQQYMGVMTVLKAIGSCGYFTDFANKRKVKLTRVDGRVLTIDCKKAEQDPSFDLEVFSGDKIHVPRKLF